MEFNIFVIDKHIFVDEHMMNNALDFVAPPLTANSLTIMQLFQIFCEKPEVQRRIQQEIDDVVGHGSLPRLDHRVKYGSVVVSHAVN